MRPKVALVIGAVAALVFGALLVFAPATLLSGFGITGHVDGFVLSRDVGATLLGLAIINWMARGAEAGPALRAILWGNVAVQVFEILVNGYELAVKDLPAQAAGGMAIHVLLIVVFGLAIARPDKAV